MQNSHVLRSLACTLSAALTLGSLAAAQAQNPAATPPMGWNSWDSYGLTITEQQFRDNVIALRDKLRPFGWNYAVIDEGWFFLNPEQRGQPETLRYQVDGFGRYVPVPARFPSAKTATAASATSNGNTTIDSANPGFVELSRWVHAQGLKFGIHIVRGIPRESTRLNLSIQGSAFHAIDAADPSDACPWDPTNWGIRDNAAGQAWYDALLRQYAAWGVDLLKVDCISDHPYKASEIRQIHLAIQRSGRPIVLSVSPGPTALAHAGEVAALAQMWRISDDVWDLWRSDPSKEFPQSVTSQFARLDAWSHFTKPGNWPDADMLPIGDLRPSPGDGNGPRASRLTATEQQTQLTLWSIARSPLILGNNLTLLDASTLRLLTNRDLIRINQTASASRQTLHDGDLIAWTADLPADLPAALPSALPASEHALALFNLGDAPLTVTRPLSALGLKPAAMRNLWTGERFPASATLSVTLPPHGSAVWLFAAGR